MPAQTKTVAREETGSSLLHAVMVTGLIFLAAVNAIVLVVEPSARLTAIAWLLPLTCCLMHLLIPSPHGRGRDS